MVCGVGLVGGSMLDFQFTTVLPASIYDRYVSRLFVRRLKAGFIRCRFVLSSRKKIGRATTVLTAARMQLVKPQDMEVGVPEQATVDQKEQESC